MLKVDVFSFDRSISSDFLFENAQALRILHYAHTDSLWEHTTKYRSAEERHSHTFARNTSAERRTSSFSGSITQATGKRPLERAGNARTALPSLSLISHGPR